MTRIVFDHLFRYAYLPTIGVWALYHLIRNLPELFR